MILVETGRPILSICGSEAGVTGKIFFFFDHEMVYMTPGLLAPDRIHLSQRWKGIFVHKLEGLIERALN